MNLISRPFDRVFQILGLRIIIWFAIVRVVHESLLTLPLKMIEYFDAHFYDLHEEASRLSIMTYHQFPFWNPFYCGGIPIIANPQDNTLAPDFLFRLLFGGIEGRYLSVIFYTMLGLEGVYRYARRNQTSAVASTYAAIVFATCGFFTGIIHLGWISFFAFQLTPWGLYFFEESLSDWRKSYLAGGILAWLLLCTGTYSLPYNVILLSLLMVIRTFDNLKDGKPWWIPLRSYCVMGLTALGLSAIRLLPLFKVVSKMPRIWLAEEVYTPAYIVERLTDAHGASYIGVGALCLGVVGLFVRTRPSHVWSLLAVISFLLSLGSFHPLAPTSLLHHLPFYSQLREPHRYVVFISLFVGLTGARVLQVIEDTPAYLLKRFRVFNSNIPIGAISLASSLGVAYLAWLLVGPMIRHNASPAGDFTMAPPAKIDRPFQQSRGNRWDAHVWPAMNRGSLQCFEETPFPQSEALRTNLPAEEYPLSPPQATVERIRWSPNEILLRVNSPTETVVAINQNWNQAWKAKGAKIENREGLLTLRVPAGTNTVRVYFRDWVLIFGGVISTLTAIGLFLHYNFNWVSKQWRRLHKTAQAWQYRLSARSQR